MTKVTAAKSSISAAAVRLTPRQPITSGLHRANKQQKQEHSRSYKTTDKILLKELICTFILLVCLYLQIQSYTLTVFDGRPISNSISPNALSLSLSWDLCN